MVLAFVRNTASSDVAGIASGTLPDGLNICQASCNGLANSRSYQAVYNREVSKIIVTARVQDTVGVTACFRAVGMGGSLLHTVSI
jgi:hypothetical protein